jgi:hypothetical protein
VEYIDEGSATVAKEALHNYKLDGEQKIKVCLLHLHNRYTGSLLTLSTDHLRQKVASVGYVNVLSPLYRPSLRILVFVGVSGDQAHG